MKKLAPLFIALFILNSSVAFGQNWVNDFEEAKSIASQEDQNIILFFTGSDWCPPCIKLERNVFSKKIFQKFAEEKFIWVKADFPKRKKNKLSEEQQKKNEALADKYNKRWVFPIILLINPDGSVLGAVGYRRNMSAQDYIDLFTTFDSFGR